jgi:hypothetical protein
LKVETRLILSFVLRLGFMVFAGWIALVPDTLPGAPMLLRMGLAATLLVIAILVGEVAKLQTQFEMLLKALRAAGASVAAEAAAPQRDDEAAIAILIRALGSREEATREKAHANLLRITGQELPLDREAWQAWWDAQREAASRA